MCMCSGVEPTEKLSGAPYVQLALTNVLGDFGPIFITCAINFKELSSIKIKSEGSK